MRTMDIVPLSELSKSEEVDRMIARTQRTMSRRRRRTRADFSVSDDFTPTTANVQNRDNLCSNDLCGHAQEDNSFDVAADSLRDFSLKNKTVGLAAKRNLDGELNRSHSHRHRRRAYQRIASTTTLAVFLRSHLFWLVQLMLLLDSSSSLGVAGFSGPVSIFRSSPTPHIVAIQKTVGATRINNQIGGRRTICTLSKRFPLTAVRDGSAPNGNDGASNEDDEDNSVVDSNSSRDVSRSIQLLDKEQQDQDATTTEDDNDDPCIITDDQEENDSQLLSQFFQAEIDLAREQTRMESFEEYVLVSVLTASASFGILTQITSTTLFEGQSSGGLVSTTTDLSELPFFQQSLPMTMDSALSIVAITCAGLSTLCGLHATVVFSLSALYGKSCIGRQRDDYYQYLLQELVPERRRAFQSFSSSLLLFSCQVGLLLYQSMPIESVALRATAGLIGTAMLSLIISDWYTIIDRAKIIYEDEYAKDQEA